MSEAHPNPNPMDDPAPQPLLLGFIVSILLTLVTIIASAAIYFRGISSAETRVASEIGPRMLEARQRQAAELARLGWVDPEKKTAVKLPIDDAIAITARELAAKGNQ